MKVETQKINVFYENYKGKKESLSISVYYLNNEEIIELNNKFCMVRLDKADFFSGYDDIVKDQKKRNKNVYFDVLEV